MSADGFRFRESISGEPQDETEQGFDGSTDEMRDDVEIETHLLAEHW